MIRSKTPVQKLKEMLQQPMLNAHQRCHGVAGDAGTGGRDEAAHSGAAAPLLEQEYALLAGVLEEGNRQGVFDVPDTLRAARTLKTMCLGFLPPYPCVSTQEEIAAEIAEIVDLTVRGLRK